MIEIILHCSACNYGNAAIIDKWHKKRGFRKIGYHYVILNGKDKFKYRIERDGLIQKGRPITEKGAHVAYHNKNSIAICLIGKSGKFTERQIDSLLMLIYTLGKELKKKGVKIELHQHSEYDPRKKFCAGLDMKELTNKYNLYVLIKDYFFVDIDLIKKRRKR
jgi:hypothetical protein